MFVARLVTIVLPFTCLAAPAGADESALYGGLRFGTIAADLPNFGDTTGLGVTLGYDIHADANGTLALETDYSTTVADGDAGAGGGWDADSIAAYGAYRTAGDVYVKAKAGFLEQDINRSGGGQPSFDDTGFAYGAGVGWRYNSKAALEVEYTSMSDELSFFSFAYVTHF